MNSDNFTAFFNVKKIYHQFINLQLFSQAVFITKFHKNIDLLEMFLKKQTLYAYFIKVQIHFYVSI